MIKRKREGGGEEGRGRKKRMRKQRVRERKRRIEIECFGVSVSKGARICVSHIYVCAQSIDRLID
jgi:hypothetical protein